MDKRQILFNKRRKDPKNVLQEQKRNPIRLGYLKK